jgi:transposase-like protein
VVLGSAERICSTPKHRRQFSPQFKPEALQMMIETGKPIAQVTRKSGGLRQDAAVCTRRRRKT